MAERQMSKLDSRVAGLLFTHLLFFTLQVSLTLTEKTFMDSVVVNASVMCHFNKANLKCPTSFILF